MSKFCISFFFFFRNSWNLGAYRSFILYSGTSSITFTSQTFDLQIAKSVFHNTRLMDINCLHILFSFSWHPISAFLIESWIHVMLMSYKYVKSINLTFGHVFCNALEIHDCFKTREKSTNILESYLTNYFNILILLGSEFSIPMVFFFNITNKFKDLYPVNYNITSSSDLWSG